LTLTAYVASKPPKWGKSAVTVFVRMSGSINHSSGTDVGDLEWPWTA